MSRVWTWRQAIFESDMQATTKLVLRALASHLNDMGGPMFPSQERLAKLCSLSERSVITHLQIAEEAGWIVANKRQLDGSKWAANEYAARFPDGVKEVHPKSDRGVKDVHLWGEGGSPSGVKEVHTNSPLEHSKEHSSPPNPPRGPCGWEENLDFMKIMEAYSAINPSRVNPAKAWAVWREQALDGHAEKILASLPSFAALDQWKKEGGKYVPNFAKWLGDGAWRTTKVALQVTAEELERRRKITSAGLSALARVESCRRFGTEPEADDLAAVRRWEELRAQLG